MNIDPQLAPVLDDLKSFDDDPVHLMEPSRLRAIQAKGRKVPPRPSGISVEDRQIAADGRNIPIRLYRPDSTGQHAALLYLHGGGWVTGGLDSHDPICARFAADAGVTVVAVDYRLAPETPYPGALEDCQAVADWMFENAGLLGLDRNRMVVGGDSAGGNLSAAICLKMRDAARADRFALQMLFYPVTDNDVDTASYIENRDAPLLDRNIMMWVLGHYLGKEWRSIADCYALPFKAPTLRGLPPAYVATAQRDPLLDEGARFAMRLIEDGVRCEYRVAPDMIHGFLRFPALSDCAESEFRAAVSALLRSVGGG